jgi:hypothetical protein
VKRLLVVLFTIAALTSTDVSGQSERESIQGVWRVVEVTMTGPAARTISQMQPNLTIITARHYSRVEIQAEGPRPIPTDVTKASADELRAVWGPFYGEAGTYDLTNDNMITLRPIVAKNPAAMAAESFSTYSYKLAGNTLWVTLERNQNGPVANPVTIKAVRAE